MPEPSAYELWVQAGGGTKDYNPAQYLELLLEAGMILYPGDKGYEEAPRNLSCGWPHRSESTGQSAEEAADIIRDTGA